MRILYYSLTCTYTLYILLFITECKKKTPVKYLYYEEKPINRNNKMTQIVSKKVEESKNTKRKLLNIRKTPNQISRNENCN